MTTESKRTKIAGKTPAVVPMPLSIFDVPGVVPEQFGTTQVQIESELSLVAPIDRSNQQVDIFGETLVTTEPAIITPAATTSPSRSELKAQVNPKNSGETAKSQSLYRKWRSQTFNELVGQEAVTRTLQNAVSSGKIGHAYLFCGPRGTGKTSSARLLAKAVNCLEPDVTKRPCNHCEPCRSIAEGRAMDLIEIDAASNRGIDEIRDLRDRINYQPNQLRYKVYIIDEVHMLTEAAFNALLKTLEEPPPHAIFVLATTDPQDIPATVVSRCQRFDFQRIGLEQSVARLAYVCDQEGIGYERAALELVARQSTGSLRDALSLLDQLVVYSDGIIQVKTVQTLLGVMNTEAVTDFANALLDANMAAGLDTINKLVQSGADLKRFNRELVEHLRSLMLVKVNPAAVRNLELPQETIQTIQNQSQHMELPFILNLLKIFSQVDYNLKVSPYVQLPLEIALMEALLGPSETVATAKVATPTSRSSAPTQPKPAVVVNPPQTVATAEAKPAPEIVRNVEPWVEPSTVAAPAPLEAEPNAEGEEQDLELDMVLGVWSKVLDQIKADNKITIHAVLKDARPTAVNGNRIRLSFKYEFHYKQINSTEKRQYVERHFGQVLGQKILLDCIYEEVTITKTAAPAEPERKKKGYGNLAQTFNARPLDT